MYVFVVTIDYCLYMGFCTPSRSLCLKQQHWFGKLSLEKGHACKGIFAT